MKNRLKQIRKYASVTQEEFAKKLGLSRNLIAQAETDKCTLSDRTLKDICREFHINEEWLRSGTGDMYTEPDDEDAAALADMLNEAPTSPVVQSLIGLYKMYSQLDDINKKIVDDMVRDLAKKISE